MTDPLNITPGAVVSVDPETTQRLVTELREARARAESAEQERDKLRALDESLGADKWLPELNRAERERTAAQEQRDAAHMQLAQVTAERDDLAQKLSGKWTEREVEARVMTELGTGPVAFERNQLRDEVAELRAKLRAQCDGLNKHWEEQVRLAKAEGRRRARTLAAMLHAHVNAIAGEES